MLRISKYLIPYIALILIIGFKSKMLMGFVIILIHEFIHLITARVLGFSGFTVEILPIGAVLKLKDLEEATPKEDLIISVSGPLGNFIMALACIAINYFYKSDFLTLMINYNLVIGIFNLIPAFPLDGGRILRDIFATRLIYKKANEIALRISISIGYVFLLSFFTSLFMGIPNLNLLLIAIFILVISYREKRRIAYIIMGYIIKKKEKLTKRGYIENKSISVYYKLSLLQVLELVDKNKYNVFTILDEEMNVMDIIYEEEILNAIKFLGNITLEELVNNREARIKDVLTGESIR
ncbi:stage IV sporulation protein FB [Clostridium punense]|uniref:Stage IV sporulation protein FB n=1 Tax=Clostridium punense TaxID=1054297 RepID=A0ABS4JXK3_9CLOT|nr:M50 family metallopeptidase [Clostridium punense]MBP2020262.1 stage IV sporulation protein FB [Clostridium punense]